VDRQFAHPDVEPLFGRVRRGGQRRGRQDIEYRLRRALVHSHHDAPAVQGQAGRSPVGGEFYLRASVREPPEIHGLLGLDDV